MTDKDKFVVVEDGERTSPAMDRQAAEAEAAARRKKLQESGDAGVPKDVTVKQNLMG